MNGRLRFEAQTHDSRNSDIRFGTTLIIGLARVASAVNIPNKASIRA